MTEIFQDTYFWTTFSFLGFCIVAYVFGRKSALNTLDAYIAHIRARIDEAELLHKKATEQAIQFEQRYANAATEAKAIVDQASVEAKAIVDAGNAELQKRLNARQKQFDAEMKQLEDSAIQELRAHMAALVEEMAIAQLKAALTKDAQSALIDQSIKTAGNAAKAA